MFMTARSTLQIPFDKLRRRVDFGLLATLVMCLFTAWPLAQQPGLPNGTDTLYHTYRVAEMDRAWAQGVLMPRWAESFYYGYGSPVFHYYASLTYYVTSTLARVFALDAVDSLRALTVLTMLLAGGGMYLFMRDSVSKLAGIIAALAYVYSPYMLFTEPYTRGAYPELLALALFPLVMGRYQRLLQTGGAWALLWAALSSGALIITHNLMALALTGLLAAWVIWQGITRQVTFSRFVFTFAAVMFGVGLTAYFWIPVILEQDAARLGNLTAVAQLDYRNFFVPLAELLAFSLRPDAGAINGLLHQLNLGVAQWTLAAAGMVGVLTRAIRTSPPGPLSVNGEGEKENANVLASAAASPLFFALASAALVFLMLPQAAFLWQATAPLAFLQFPWRFLGPAAFCLAFLAGMNALWLERLPARIQAFLVVMVLALPVALALPTLYVDEWENTAVDTSVAAYHTAELSGLQRATTFSDEYLPSTVIVEPSASASLLADYADGYPVDKANRAALPDHVTLTPLDHGPQHDTWQVVAEAAFTLEALTYYFPGWQVEIDGQPVETRPSEPHGLITFDVPAGEHVIRLYMGTTPARNLGLVVTIIAGIGLVVGAWLARQKGESPGESRFALAEKNLTRTGRRTVIAAGIIQLALVLVFMREGLAWVDSPPGSALVARNQTVFNLGESIQLLGYDLNGRSFRAGDRLELTLYWYGRERIDYGYAVFVHVSNGGPPVAQADQQNPAGRPTLKWTPDGYIRDPYAIDLNVPPGEYQLTVGMYTCDTRPPGECGNGERPPVTSADGRPLGDAVPLGTIVVR